jgi:hypothetical protein
MEALELLSAIDLEPFLYPDSYVEAGEVEWQCSICYHENHPAKRECIMCGTPEGASSAVC